MKKVLFTGLIWLLFGLFPHAYAGEVVPSKQTGQVVTSEQLSISDVKKSVVQCLASQECTLGKVLGIHQEGNSARVYTQYAFKSGKRDLIVIDLVRFNSGKWFNTSLKDFVTK